MRSLHHNDSGPAPGVKNPDGNWDLRPHAQRIVEVDDSVLTTWAALIDEPGTPPMEARMLYPVNRSSAEVLDKIAAAPRLGDIDFQWTAGWHESADRKAGFFESQQAVPVRWEDVILQGPHLTVATPTFQQPETTNGRQHLYDEVDLDSIHEDFIPRTNYQVAKPYSEYIAAYPKWHDKPSSGYFRLAWREMCDVATVRTLQTALLPPGPTHVHAVHTLTLPGHHRELAIWAGISHSIVADFMVKTIGSSHVKASTWHQIPLPNGHPLVPQLLLRTLRLNCLVRPYATLWEELYDPNWQHDSWVSGIDFSDGSRETLSAVGPKWEPATPLRNPEDRRQALIEIDAIVSIMINLTLDELSTIYRTQFPVLQKRDNEAVQRFASAARTSRTNSSSEVSRDRALEISHNYFNSLLSHLSIGS